MDRAGVLPILLERGQGRTTRYLTWFGFRGKTDECNHDRTTGNESRRGQ